MSEYPVASIVLQTRENWTLAVGANSFLAEHQKLWGRFAALQSSEIHFLHVLPRANLSHENPQLVKNDAMQTLQTLTGLPRAENLTRSTQPTTGVTR